MDRIAEAFHVVATGDVGFQEADAFLQSIGQGCEPASWDALRGIVAKKDMPVGTRRQAALLLRAMVRRSLDERQTGETLVCVSGDCWAADTPGLNAAVAALVANCLVFHAKRIEEFLAAILKGPGPQVAVLVICAIPAELTDTRTRLPTALKEAVVESLSTPSFSETLQHLTVELQRFDAVTALLPLLIASGGSSPSFRSTFGEAPQPKGLAVLRQQMEPLLLSATRCACSSWGAAGDPPAQVRDARSFVIAAIPHLDTKTAVRFWPVCGQFAAECAGPAKEAAKQFFVGITAAMVKCHAADAICRTEHALTEMLGGAAAAREDSGDDEAAREAQLTFSHGDAMHWLATASSMFVDTLSLLADVTACERRRAAFNPSDPAGNSDSAALLIDALSAALGDIDLDGAYRSFFSPTGTPPTPNIAFRDAAAAPANPREFSAPAGSPSEARSPRASPFADFSTPYGSSLGGTVTGSDGRPKRVAEVMAAVLPVIAECYDAFCASRKLAGCPDAWGRLGEDAAPGGDEAEQSQQQQPCSETAAATISEAVRCIVRDFSRAGGATEVLRGVLLLPSVAAAGLAAEALVGLPPASPHAAGWLVAHGSALVTALDLSTSVAARLPSGRPRLHTHAPAGKSPFSSLSAHLEAIRPSPAAVSNASITRTRSRPDATEDPVLLCFYAFVHAALTAAATHEPCPAAGFLHRTVSDSLREVISLLSSHAVTFWSSVVRQMLQALVEQKGSGGALQYCVSYHTLVTCLARFGAAAARVESEEAARHASACLGAAFGFLCKQPAAFAALVGTPELLEVVCSAKETVTTTLSRTVVPNMSLSPQPMDDASDPGDDQDPSLQSSPVGDDTHRALRDEYFRMLPTIAQSDPLLFMKAVSSGRAFLPVYSLVGQLLGACGDTAIGIAQACQTGASGFTAEQSTRILQDYFAFVTWLVSSYPSSSASFDADCGKYLETAFAIHHARPSRASAGCYQCVFSRLKREKTPISPQSALVASLRAHVSDPGSGPLAASLGDEQVFSNVLNVLSTCLLDPWPALLGEEFFRGCAADFGRVFKTVVLPVLKDATVQHAMSAAASLTFCKGFLLLFRDTPHYGINPLLPLALLSNALCLDGRPVPVVMHLACGDYIAAVIKIVPKPAFTSLVEAAPGGVPAPLPTFPYYWNRFAQAVAKSIDENRNIRHAIRTLLNL